MTPNVRLFNKTTRHYYICVFDSDTIKYMYNTVGPPPPVSAKATVFISPGLHCTRLGKSFHQMPLPYKATALC